MPNRVSVQPAGNLNLIFETIAPNQVFDWFAHGPVADQRQITRNALLFETIDGFNEEQLALLLGEPSDADQMWRRRRNRFGSLKKAFINPAVNYVDLAPVSMVTPAEELAAAKLADGDDKRGAGNLFAKGELSRHVELVGTVNRDAVWDVAEAAGQHGHGGGVRAEMVVQMAYAPGSEVLGQHTGFHEIGDRPKVAANPGGSRAQGKAESAEKTKRGHQ